MKRFFLILLIAWIFLAFLTIPYNVFKIFSEVKQWAFLSDYQKKEKLFGDTFNFIKFVESNTTKNSYIFIFSADDKIGLISRYFLYPRSLYVTKNSKDLTSINLEKYDYIALYDKEIINKNYKEISRYLSKISSNYGIVYKKDD